MIRPREELRHNSTGMSSPREDDWRDRASCLGLDVNDFVPEGQGHHVPPEVLRVCASCPVLQSCFDFAVTVRPEFGYFAGTSPKDRRKLKPGDTPPLMTHLCACGNTVARRRARVCDDCQRAKARERDAKRRAANQERVAS